MTISTNPLSRRTVLKQKAKALSLPFLSSLLPVTAKLEAEKKFQQAPKRLLWMAIGHGHMEKHFYPTQVGKWSDIEVPISLKPLKRNFNHFTMVSNFTNNQNQRPHGGTEALLTCSDIMGFPGKRRHNSVSCDQVAAAVLGVDTRYESIQLNSDDKSTGSGEGHEGVAMSFRNDGSPLTGYDSPFDVYRLLYGGGLTKAEQLVMLKQRRSVFDILGFQNHSLKTKLDKEDANKLEEYTTSVRDIEMELSRQQDWVKVPLPKAGIEEPSRDILGEQAIRLMFKLIISAYQTDSTRVFSYRFPAGKLLRSMGMNYSPHTLSHYGSNTMLHELNQQRSTKHCQLFSDFIDQLKQAKDPLDPNGGTIYDHSLVYLGGGLRTAHRTLNLPALLTGGGFKGLTHGSHLMAEKENTPLANLWTTMLQDAGVSIQKFADANGTASDIFSMS